MIYDASGRQLRRRFRETEGAEAETVTDAE